MSYYQDLSKLPNSVRNSLPLHARVIYMNAYNHAWEEYADAEKRRDDSSREETAGRIAWAAVKQVYEKDIQSGLWKRKKSRIAVPG